MLRIALYQPDIPQNTGATMRLCACLGMGLDIIEPCGFVLDDKKIRRSGMDYINSLALARHTSWRHFLDLHQGKQRLVLLTTKAEESFTDFEFRPDDILLAGRESAGVPDDVHNAADARILIPMPGGGRSLNVVNSLAMVAGEALRQTGGFK
ncbi:MAG: tRNA (cytidine(34)-2'-O)-methyltransferase [Rhodospirillales bacterium]|nr:tRNA (cytidine(34)-2'-O)-methyltransferase [Rhodospirillales bacterium]